MSLPIQRTDLRRALIRFSAMIVGLITVVGLMSLFAIWSMNRAYYQTEQTLDSTHALAIEAFQAQIAFKVQVQEWKNTLLRGSDPHEKAFYWQAFEQREIQVQQHLSRFRQVADQLGMDHYSSQAQALIAHHQHLAEVYRQALAEADGLDDKEAKRSDQLVKGIDRELENAIHHLGESLLSDSATRRDTLLEQLSLRYMTLRGAMLTFLLAALLLTLASLYGVLRITGDPTDRQ